MKVVVLVGTLALVVLGAHAPKQPEVACTLTRGLVVVDLDDVSIATSSTTPSTLAARAISASSISAGTKQRRTAAHR
jgi:hypothetical protein